MQRGVRHARKRARTGFAAAGLRLSLIAILIALVSQTLAFGVHSARAADDARLAAVTLSKAVGAPVVLCVQDEGGPSDSSPCHQACPLCQLAAQTAALAAPDAPAAPAPPPALGVDRPLIPAASRIDTEPIGLPFATGPPRSL